MRQVWVTDANAILMTTQAVGALRSAALRGVGFRRAVGRWGEDASSSESEVPDLWQLCAVSRVSVADRNIELEACECGAVRSISFDPLIVKSAAFDGGNSAWVLAENPEVTILGEEVKEILLALDPDLEFSQVWFENEAPDTADGDSLGWGDVGRELKDS